MSEGPDELRDTVLRSLRGANAASASSCHFVPGRIEVLGKHTDYAGGRSLLATVNRGFVVAAAPRADSTVRVIAAATSEQVEIDHAGRLRAGAPSWATYPAAVVRRCAGNFPSATGGADIAFASDLPQAAGLSSSSALVVASFLALDAVRGIRTTQEYGAAIHDSADLAGYLGAVENGLTFRTLAGDTGVGTMGGSEDHTAILCARPGRLVQYRFAPVRFEGSVDVPRDWTFVIASSGVQAEKTGSALVSYNRLAAATHMLVQLWRDAGAGDEPTLGAILESAEDAGLRLREIVRARATGEAEFLVARLAQFIAESEEIVPGARSALERGDIAGFGALVRRSQDLAVHALGNQTPETIDLVERAQALGAPAASAFGAGFGGSVWALVRESDAHGFAAAWRDGYTARFRERSDDARFFVTPAAAPARRIEDLP